MADELYAVGQLASKKRLKDLADGSWAEVVAVAASEAHLGAVGGHTITTVATLTRPGAGDVTQYAALDSVSNSTSAPVPLEFANAARVAAGGGLIIGAKLTKSAVSVTTPSMRLWLYNATITATNDNAALAQTLANASKRIGYIDFLSFVAGSDFAEAFGVLNATVIPFKLPAAGTSLFGLLQALGTYTPGDAEVFRIELAISQD